MSRKLLASICILIAVLSVAGVAFGAKTYGAESFDANWQINTDGSLSVVETVVFDFSGGPFTYVYRELPDDYSDGVEVLAASMDGVPLAAGAGAGQYEIEGGSQQKVTWHFPPTSDATHTFELRYRVLGAVRREGGQDVLFWNFLPTDYEYPIQSATLRVTYPAAATLIGPAEVRRGEAIVTESDGQVVFSASDIRKDSPLTVALRFAEGSLIAEPPAWQQQAALVAQRAPTMWLLTALVLALGTIFLSLVWRAGRRPSGSFSEPPTMTRSTPPSTLAPALAGALVNYGAKAGAVQAMAALFSLAQQGVLAFEETQGKTWYRGPQFVVRYQPQVRAAIRLEPQEEALVDALFTQKDGTEIPLSKLGQRLRRALQPFGKVVDAELTRRGLLDPVRARYGARFTIIGGVLLVFLVPALALAALFWQVFGGWVLLIPAALFVLSMIAFAMHFSYSIRSMEGEQQAAAWRGFKGYITAVTKGREPSWDLQMFDRYFAYAAAFDLAEGWAKAFRDRGGAEPPAWFRSLSASGSDNLGAFIVLTSATHSSVASGGGAGAGGAGGGGGSGAG